MVCFLIEPLLRPITSSHEGRTLSVAEGFLNLLILAKMSLTGIPNALMSLTVFLCLDVSDRSI